MLDCFFSVKPLGASHMMLTANHGIVAQPRVLELRAATHFSFDLG